MNWAGEFGERRFAGDVLGSNAGDFCHLRRDRAPRVDQLAVDLDLLAALKPYDADLDDPVGRGVESGRLDVDDRDRQIAP